MLLQSVPEAAPGGSTHCRQPDRVVAETERDFLKDEPMPWAGWHAGAPNESDVVQTLAVRGYPTYSLPTNRP